MRNPSNPNQHLFTEPHYNGLLVQTYCGPLIEQYLRRLYSTVHLAIQQYPRVFAVRLDLHFSRRFDLPDIAATNQPIQRFLEKLSDRLDRKDQNTRRLKGRVNPHGMRYIWAREIGPESGIPHYHLLLLFNGDAYRSVGDYSNPEAPGLYRHLQEAWAHAIGLDFELADGLVSPPKGGHWMLCRTDKYIFADMFHAASYLCKASSKVFELGIHGFNSSKI